MPPKPKPVCDRIRSKVVVTSGGCHEWPGATTNNGYGQIRIKGKTRLVHRVMYELHVGLIPDNVEIMHSCDNRRCCNPSHLSVGTRSDNMRDMVDRGRCANTAAKLSHDDVKEIRRRLSHREMHKSIAADFEISRTIVTRISLGQIWKNVV